MNPHRQNALGGMICLGVAFVFISSLTPAGAVARRHQGRVPAAVAGSVRAWGYNLEGELGDGSTTDTGTPVRVRLPAGVKVTEVRAGCNHSIALTSTGRLLAWGDNSFGQLGDGSTTGSDLPVRVKLPARTKITSVEAGCGHNLALTSTGRVLAWGYNIDGELGDGKTVMGSDVPVRVKLPAGTKIKAISAGYGQSLAVTTAGQVLAWGDNFYGQLGNGTTKGSDVPVRVKLPKAATAIAVAAGAFHSLALTAAGRVLAWGYNGHGQLGDGTTADARRPTYVKLPARATVTEVSAGVYHSIALTAAGHVLAWGDNLYGQLGDGKTGTTTSSDRPVRVVLPAGTRIKTVSAGRDHNLALTASGRILAWGYNFYGQLGNNKLANSDTPVLVRLPANLTASAIGAGPGSFLSLAVVGASVIKRSYVSARRM